MPRWRSLCKPGEEPSNLIDTHEFGTRFGIKSGFGPVVIGEDGQKTRQWNRCWSCIPEEWAPAIDKLLARIRARYRVETVEDDPADPAIQVWIDQIKDKYGSLRFYYTASSQEIYSDIDKMVEECEADLAKADPYYGVPY